MSPSMTNNNSNNSLSAEQQNVQMASERAVLTKLLQAALAGDFGTVQSVVADYSHQHSDSVSMVDVLTQFRDGQKRTALHFACQSTPQSENKAQTDDSENDKDIVEEMLLSSWITPSCSIPSILRLKDKEGLTPLMLAAQVADALLAERRILAILETDSKYSSSSSKLGLARSKAGAAALHYAAGAGGTAATVQALLKAGQIALSTCSRHGGTPLHWACAASAKNSDHCETIRALLDGGADINKSELTADNLIPPPLVMAMAAGNTVTAKFLIQQAIERHLDLTPTLQFTFPDTSNNAATHDGASVFHMAADLNMVELLSMLLELISSDHESNSGGSDSGELFLLATMPNAQGLSPLDLAAREGHVGCVLLLLPQSGNDNNKTEEDAKAYIEEYQKSKHTNGIENTATPTKETIVSDTKPTTATVSVTNHPDSDEPEAIEKRAEHDAAVILTNNSVIITDDAKTRAQEYKTRGNTHFGNNAYEHACEQYSLAIATDPTDATFYSNRSACLLQLQKPNQALYDAVVARQLRPDWTKAYFRVAVARLELGLYEQAAVAAFEGLKLDATNQELSSLLKKCVKMGRKDHEKKLQEEKKQPGNKF